MYKNLEHNVKYGVITAEMRFGVVNYKLDLSQEQKDLVLSIYSTFEIKIFNDFEMMKSDEIKKVERNSDEYDELFYKFISRKYFFRPCFRLGNVNCILWINSL